MNNEFNYAFRINNFDLMVRGPFKCLRVMINGKFYNSTLWVSQFDEFQTSGSYSVL